jgi:DNA helicase-2/ATP-dependent DNA helicase PcrA
MAIACAYCGGSHDSPADVRRCWTDQGSPDVDRADALPGRDVPDVDRADALGGLSVPETDPDPVDSRADPTDLSGAVAPSPSLFSMPPDSSSPIPRGGDRAPASAGPAELGRHAIVLPGQAPPPPWTAAQRVTIDAAALTEPNEMLAVLRAAAGDRRRLTVELAADLPPAPRTTTERAPYRLRADFEFQLDELVHLVWSNSIDLRTPEHPTWQLLDAAVAAGARALDGEHGDVETPAGVAVWLDGGPTTFHDPIDDLAVVPAVTVEHRSFATPTANDTAAELAPDQRAAVTHRGGSARIVAPAGSGKTRVLTERARHLLTRWNLPPGAVCLVAFNKRAQEEMSQRTVDLPGLQVRTLNSIALAVINGTPPFARREGRYGTIAEPDVRRIIGDLVSFPRRRNSDPVAPWIEALSSIRLGLTDPAEVEARYAGEVEGLATVWPIYRQRLERQGVVDFDGQIYRALEVLLTDPEARRTAQRACRLMLVDEFQDLTPAHLLLVRLLAGGGGAVFGVGDDDQTIYGYNGADPTWLIDFARLFPGSGDHPLTVNYRCPAGVVDAVDRLLRHNRRRVAKTITASSTDPEGWSVDGSVDAVGATAAHVAAAIAAGVPSRDIAVLTRVNAVLAPVQVALNERSIPVAGGVGTEFLERTAVRAVLAWLRLAVAVARGEPFAPDDLQEALRRPSRSFHPKVLSWIGEQRDLPNLFGLSERLRNERDSERLADFADDLQVLGSQVERGAAASDVVLTLVETIGLAGSVSTLDATRRGMNRSAQGDDLTAMLHLAALHDDVAGFGSWLRRSLSIHRREDGVVLATVHRVKGQEWPHVVVHLAAADQYPHRLAEDVEEERRLLHVAITRASRRATLVSGPAPSPFIDELTREPRADLERVQLHEPAAPPRAGGGGRRSPGRTPARAGGADDLDETERERYAALVELRQQLRDGKPAYTVFDNKTLASIARRAPTTLPELRKISGVGPAKLERYGDVVTELMRRLTAAV